MADAHPLFQIAVIKGAAEQAVVIALLAAFKTLDQPVAAQDGAGFRVLAQPLIERINKVIADSPPKRPHAPQPVTIGGSPVQKMKALLQTLCIQPQFIEYRFQHGMASMLVITRPGGPLPMVVVRFSGNKKGACRPRVSTRAPGTLSFRPIRPDRQSRCCRFLNATLARFL